MSGQWTRHYDAYGLRITYGCRGSLKIRSVTAFSSGQRGKLRLQCNYTKSWCCCKQSAILHVEVLALLQGYSLSIHMYRQGATCSFQTI